jgi:hypothetical protein
MLKRHHPRAREATLNLRLAATTEQPPMAPRKAASAAAIKRVREVRTKQSGEKE